MKSLFFTIKQTADAFKRPKAGTEKEPKTTSNIDYSIKKSEALARIAITFILFFLVIYLFRFGNSENSYVEIANIIIGAILGYWFR